MRNFYNAEWYERMARWSESAAGIGDVETMIIAELAQGHDVTLELVSADLRPEQRAGINKILRSHSPRLAACRIADRW